MSSLKEIKRQLHTAARALATLDAELSAGRVSAEEHARQRAERERDVGRLYLTLRELQSNTRHRTAEPARSELPPASLTWWRHPAILASAAAMILIAGAGVGVVLTRWSAEPPRPVTGSGAPFVLPPGVGTAAPPNPSAASMNPIELQALRLATTRDDAPIDSLLRLAHIDLDAGRLDMARALYDRVLIRDPKNVEAITHQGSILSREGRTDEALAKVETALGIDPSYIHAHWDRVQYLFHGKRDFSATVKAGEAFLKVVPDGPDAAKVRRIIAEARQSSRR